MRPEDIPHWQDELLESLRKKQDDIVTPVLRAQGIITRMVGLTMEAKGIGEPIGARVQVLGKHGEAAAEVVGFLGERTFLMPSSAIEGLAVGARAKPLGEGYEVRVGEGLLGRVIDAHGHPLDGKGRLPLFETRPLRPRSPSPLSRPLISRPLDVGIRSVNALLTLGQGQRVGLFAGSGVGKSVLLGMMARYTAADVVVVGLVGERGREVRDFIEKNLGEGLSRAVVVAAPADEPPLCRLHASLMATTCAEYFRDQGAHVLLLMDSLTRFAQASREIGLAVGEPPATKGYPPSVFARLPQLTERAGMNEKGSITAIYTVLVEGDDLQDPVADAARATLDGHVVLSRVLADSGLYPAVDIEASISRLMPDVVDENHLQLARKIKDFWGTYSQHRDLITVGAYAPGSDPRVDEAIRAYPRIRRFLNQDMGERVSFAEALEDLQAMAQEWETSRAQIR